MKQTRYPIGWDEERVKRVLEHYEQQSDEEAVADDEAGFESTTYTAMWGTRWSRSRGPRVAGEASRRMSDRHREVAVT